MKIRMTLAESMVAIGILALVSRLAQMILTYWWYGRVLRHW